MPFVKLYFKC